ncbi:MAG: RNA methyltransferase [Muribaculaceae bacterium]|nr:RNA methyltransferase [Muribaculaceae bacterium]
MEISKTKVSILSSLSSKKMRQKYGLFLAEGTKCVFDMLGAFELVSIVATTGWLKKHIMPQDVEESQVLTAGEETMKKISSLSTPPEVIAVFKLPTDADGRIEISDDRLYLMLDGIQDPGNFGTIIRTADWFGFDMVICSKDTVDVYNPKVVQATMGSLKRVRVVYTDLTDLIRKYGITPVYGTMLEGENIFEKDLLAKGVIVMGNEGKGLSEEIRSLVTDPLLIPPTRKDTHAESLNVAIATAITIAQFRK